MSINGIKVATRKIVDNDPTGGYVGIVQLPGGNDISTCRLRKSRTSAREDAMRLAASIAHDPDFPLTW
jgi:hypothetical protein